MNPARVLVVDDDESMLRLVRMRLGNAGIAADTALSAEDALTIMRTNLYYVVILDINMPGMSGVEMVEALKQRNPLVQVIMLTVEASFGRVLDCVDRGAVDFFTKTEDLSEMIDSARVSLTRAARWARLIGHQVSPPAPVGT